MLNVSRPGRCHEDLRASQVLGGPYAHRGPAGGKAAKWNAMRVASLGVGWVLARMEDQMRSAVSITADNMNLWWFMISELVGVRGFEPPTPSSRRKCATRLRYTPRRAEYQNP